MENKKLYRSTTNQIIGGVAGGLGEYLEIDPTLIRLGFVLLTVFGGVGPVAYIVLMIILPKKESQPIDAADNTEVVKAKEMTANQEVVKTEDGVNERSRSNLVPLIMITVGTMALANRILPYWISWENIWPLALILVGLFIIFKR